MMKKTFLNNLPWRFATKQFDPTKKVSEKDLRTILESVRMAPSSFGLQQYHLYVVEHKALRKQMMQISYFQKQISAAPVVLVFCARTDIEKRIDKYEELSTEKKLSEKLKFAPVKLIMKTLVSAKKKNSQLLTWSTHQAYIALGFALAACAELQIDSCPMEGFDQKKMNRLLHIPDTMQSVVLLPIGYRKEEPKRKKVRFPIDELITRLS